MYINFEYLKSKDLSYEDLIVLQMCKQNKFEDLSKELSNIDQKVFDSLAEKALITAVKPKRKSDTIHQLLRTTKKANELLDNIDIPEVTDEDIKLFDWISNVYTKLGKEIGNKKKTKRYIALFRVNSGITKNKLARLMEVFVNDNSNMEYNHKLQNALYLPPTAYETRFQLDESRLYKYYLKNKDYFDKLFETIDKKEAATT